MGAVDHFLKEECDDDVVLPISMLERICGRFGCYIAIYTRITPTRDCRHMGYPSVTEIKPGRRIDGQVLLFSEQTMFKTS